MVEETPHICIVCAWRENCQKKSKETGFRCPDFTRDISIKPPPKPGDDKAQTAPKAKTNKKS